MPLFADMPSRPIRDTLYELTSKVTETGSTPLEGYELLMRLLATRGLQHYTDYASSSITSGGHARNDSLSMRDIIRRNTDSALALGDELFENGQLLSSMTVEAVALGKTHWSQSDYMEFWLAVMSRPAFGSFSISSSMESLSRDFSTRLDAAAVDLELYNGPSAPAESRAAEYFRHADVFAETVHHHADAYPIQRLVRLIDPETSLGAQTENYFAKIMGSYVMRVAVAHVSHTGLSAENFSPRLVDDMNDIVSFGGVVFDARRREQLVLVPQD